MRRTGHGIPAAAWVVVLLLVGGCTTASGPPAAVTTTVPAAATDADEQRHPDVIDAELERTDQDWRLSATISSPYDTPRRYADAFRARTEDGTVLGVRELLHDHADEQPFTRTLTGLEIPDGVDRIVVEARDLRYGWGGGTVTVAVPEDAG